MKTLGKWPHIVSVLTVLAMLSSHTAYGDRDLADADTPAQTSQPSAAPAANASGVEEIVVTAQKREELLKVIPISISALSANTMAIEHIENYDDLARAVPGLGIGSSGYGVGTGQMNVELRGVSSITGSSTVGIYIDDVSVTTKNFYDGNTQPLLFDLDRTEVLRGPQGTLYGASSEGGTIRFITTQPKLGLFEGSVSTSVSDQEHGGIGNADLAMINIPIVSDKLAVRASAAYNYAPGWIDHLSETGADLQKGVNAEKDWVVHLEALYEPSDDWTITPALFAQQNKMADSPAFYPGGATTNPPFYPGEGLWNQDKFIQESDTDQVLVGSLKIQKDFDGFGSLTSVTGLFLRDVDRYQDGTLYNSYTFATLYLDPILTPGNPGYVPGPLTANPIEDTKIGAIPSPVYLSGTYKTYSQEFRLASETPEESGLPLSWVVGIYGSYQKITDTVIQHIPGVNSAFQSIYGVPLNSSTQLATAVGVTAPFAFFPDDVDEWQEQRYGETSVSGFGQLDYQFLSNLHGSIGARYEIANFSFYSSEYGFYTIGEPGTATPYTEGSTYYSLTPKFSLTYDVDEDFNVYASAGKGVRFGGPTGPIPPSVCAGDLAYIGLVNPPTKFNSDKLWSYELGSKNRLMNNSLSIDAAVFYIDWSGMQQQYWLPTCGYPVELNIGDAVSEGGEMEIHYKPVEGLTLGIAANVDYTKVTSTVNPAAAQVGERILNVPRYTVNLSGEYMVPVFQDKEAFVRTDYSYIGSSSGTFITAYPDYSDPAYGVLNASIGINWDRYELSIYGKNINDNHTIISKPEVNTMFEGYTVHPLTVGLTAKATF